MNDPIGAIQLRIAHPFARRTPFREGAGSSTMVPCAHALRVPVGASEIVRDQHVAGFVREARAMASACAMPSPGEAAVAVPLDPRFHVPVGLAVAHRRRLRVI
jgi:hypothetical protein